MIFNRRLEARDLNLRCTFEGKVAVPDGAGGETVTWQPVGYAPWCRLEDVGTPSEGVSVGAVAEIQRAVLSIRDNSKARMITPQHRVQVSGLVWNIRGRYALAPQRGFLRFTIETGVAQ